MKYETWKHEIENIFLSWTIIKKTSINADNLQKKKHAAQSVECTHYISSYSFIVFDSHHHQHKIFQYSHLKSGIASFRRSQPHLNVFTHMHVSIITMSNLWFGSTFSFSCFVTKSEHIFSAHKMKHIRTGDQESLSESEK